MTSGPHSLISVYVPAVGSTTAVDVRDSPRDADEVVEDRLGGQLLDDPRAGPAAGEPGRDDGHLEELQRARDVDPLPAREREDVARAMPVADLEAGNGERAVEGRVRGDGDDHAKIPQRFAAVRSANQLALPRSPGSVTASAATSLDDAHEHVAVPDLDPPEALALPHRELDRARRDHALDERTSSRARSASPYAARTSSHGRAAVAGLGPRVDPARVDHGDAPVARDARSGAASGARRFAVPASRRRAPCRRPSPRARRAAAACDQPASAV